VRLRAAIRIGLRASWRDRWMTLLCAGFVALAVGLSELLLTGGGGSRSAVDGARARITLVGHVAGAEPALVVRVGPRDIVDVQALGAGNRMTFGASGSGTGELAGDRVPTVTAPAGTTVLTFHSDTTRVQHGDRAVAVDVDDADLEAPAGALEGTISDGRAPAAPGEVAATADLLATLRAGLGSRVILRTGVLAGTDATVVGVLARGEDGDPAPTLLVAPRLLATSTMRTFEAAIPPSGLSSSRSGGGQSSVSSSGGPIDAPGPTSSMVQGSSGVVGGGLVVAYYFELAIFETVLLVLPMLLMIAVLAVGMSRRLEELRLLALSGATVRFIGLVASVRGVVVALLGGVLGIAVAAAIAALAGATATPDLAAVTLPVLPAVVASIWASRAATGAATRIGTVRDRVGRRALSRDALFGVGLCAAAPLAAALADRLGATGALAALPAIALAGFGLYRLARVAVWLPGTFPLPPALRASVRATGRARWVSAPAAFGVGLVAIVATGTATAPGSSDSTGTTPALVYVMPGPLADASGAAISPRVVVAGIVPPASRVVPIWVLEGTDPGMAMALDDSWLISQQDAATIGLPTASLGISAPVDVGAVGGWPRTVPHIFQLGVPRAGAVPAWLVRLPAGTTAARLASAAAAADRAGLQLVSDVGPVSSSSGGTSWTFDLTAGAIVLVFGVVACAIVLAETREEPRRLALAGARPRDLRLAAGASAFTLGLAALLVGVVVAGLLATTGAWEAASRGLIALAALPLVLGVGAAILARPPRLDGRVGRPVRDAGSRTLAG
jgi:hypothetical protein